MFNSRFKYRYTDGDGSGRRPSFPIPRSGSRSPAGSSPGSTGEGPGASGTGPAFGRPVNDVTNAQARDTDEFKALDELIDAFVASVPREFRDPVGLETGAKLDPILYMAHLLPHMCICLPAVSRIRHRLLTSGVLALGQLSRSTIPTPILSSPTAHLQPSC